MRNHALLRTRTFRPSCHRSFASLRAVTAAARCLRGKTPLSPQLRADVDSLDALPTRRPYCVVAAQGHSLASPRHATRKFSTARSSTTCTVDRLPAQAPASLDPSAPHHDLASFLAHAARTGLSAHSTVYTGTAYEYVTLAALRRYGFDLRRVGGRGDRGVDLVGFWRVPARASDAAGAHTVAAAAGAAPPLTLRVLVQCKRMVGKRAKLGPNVIRELDGALRGARLGPVFDAMVLPRAASAPAQADVEDADISGAAMTATTMGSPPGNAATIGVLVGTRPATKGVVESLRRSTRGLAWIMLEEVGTTTAAAADTESSSQGRPSHDGFVQAQSPPAPSQQEHPSVSREPDGAELEVDHEASALGSPTPRLPTGRVKQILWNQAARDLGLEGIDVVKRYASPSTLDADVEQARGDGGEELVLSRDGLVILGGGCT